MKNTQIQISGTHCQACKKILEKRIAKIAGVKSAEVNFQTGETTITAEGDISKEEIQSQIMDTDYKVI